MNFASLTASAETRRTSAQADIDACIAWAEQHKPADATASWPEQRQAAEVIGHLNSQLANIAAEMDALARLKATAAQG